MPDPPVKSIRISCLVGVVRHQPTDWMERLCWVIRPQEVKIGSKPITSLTPFFTEAGRQE
ncbi:hypothetical protein RB3507 [Rhodopirellula baltica SH 1]|uniref:Uncharacterized protein n=1 Tax=Rhodopirellula baltica (strain DSM 10527 / NCIMB 13988 / SH1) TaxID=243090 RepID=Q7UU49_RHOBA|nr:hypothetical protein RB3507 [Rhodopirellula baltica SH 1]